MQHTWPSVQQRQREDDFSGLVPLPGAALKQHLPFKKKKEKEDGHKVLMDFLVIRCWTDVSMIRQVPLRSKKTKCDYIVRAPDQKVRGNPDQKKTIPFLHISYL